MTNNVSLGSALKHSTLHLPTQKQHLRHVTEGLEVDDEHLRSTVPSPVEEEDEDAVEPSLRVGLVLHRASSGFASRANNLHSYLELNRFVRTQPYSLFRTSLRRTSPAHLQLSTVLGIDELQPSDRPREPVTYRPKGSDFWGLDHRTLDAGGGAYDHQAVGHRQALRHQQDGQSCRLCDFGPLRHRRRVSVFTTRKLKDETTDSLNGTSVKLDGCILGQGTKVHAKAELSRCVTQPAYEVQQGGQSVLLVAVP